jgi:hypothetical protein
LRKKASPLRNLNGFALLSNHNDEAQELVGVRRWNGSCAASVDSAHSRLALRAHFVRPNPLR